MNEKKSFPLPLNVGTSFLLVIFTILCMVIFGVLSLSSALKDLTCSRQNASRTAAYYDACNQAEEILAELQKEDSKNVPIEYSVPISETEALHITLEPNETGDSYRIRSWILESTVQWQNDSTLPVLGSEQEKEN